MLVVVGPWGLPLEGRPDMGSAGGIGVERRVRQRQAAASMRPSMRVVRVWDVGCRLSVVGWLLTAVTCPLNAVPTRTLGVGDGKSSHFGLPLTPHRQSAKAGLCEAEDGIQPLEIGPMSLTV